MAVEFFALIAVTCRIGRTHLTASIDHGATSRTLKLLPFQRTIHSSRGTVAFTGQSAARARGFLKASFEDQAADTKFSHR